MSFMFIRLEQAIKLLWSICNYKQSKKKQKGKLFFSSSFPLLLLWRLASSKCTHHTSTSVLFSSLLLLYCYYCLITFPSCKTKNLEVRSSSKDAGNKNVESHCLEIAQNVVFEYLILAFSTNFCPIKMNFCPLASLAMLNETFSVIFKHRAHFGAKIVKGIYIFGSVEILGKNGNFFVQKCDWG